MKRSGAGGAKVPVEVRGGLFVMKVAVELSSDMAVMPVDDADDAEEVVDVEQQAPSRAPEERPVSLPQPELPSGAAQALHRLLHIPHQSSCDVCVRARGRDDAHRHRAVEERATPEWSEGRRTEQ